MEKIPNILLIYTGGTIGMIKDFDTGVLRSFNFEKLLERIPELSHLKCLIKTISFEKPIDSAEMNPKHWVSMAKIIEESYQSFDGFVILHGSDTMSYSASALSFMLKNLAKPVIFTGSQLPIGDLRTDAKENLITSIALASLQKKGQPLIKEVGLYFEYKLYRGNRTTKINAEHFQAFNSFNFPPLAESGVHLKLNIQNLYKPNNQPLLVYKKMDDRVGLIKLYPGINQKAFACLASSQLKAIIIETFGTGNTATDAWFLDSLKTLINNGKHIIIVSQCAGGAVSLGEYESSAKLKKMGVISGKDITTESALVKAMFLLGKNYKQDTFKKAFLKSLRGELS